jgi:hypothetical protein
MPTRKQRRRIAKEKRHQYEFVYVDAEGNELEEPPEGLEEPKAREARTNGAKPAAKKPAQARRGRGAGRVPQPPSWQRSVRRSAMLAAVVFVLFSFTAKGNWGSVIALTLLYTALFIPFTYAIDRFAYKRWQARQEGGGASPARPAKKR